MKWGTVVHTENEQEWFESYVRLALATPAPVLPEKTQKIGSCEVTWFETEPGIAFIEPKGGSFDDRTLGLLVVAEQLKGHGIRPAGYSFDNRHASASFMKFADWDDIEQKAVRLLRGGQVQVNRRGATEVAGTVQGDHGTYATEFRMQDPNSNAITWWDCECPWSQFAWQRTRQWKKYEGRPCAHALALYWASKQVPVDEESHPGAQQSLFGMPATPTGANPSPFSAPQGAPQGQQLPMPGMFPGTAVGTPGQEGGPPPPPSAIPPNPYDPANMVPQTNPASVPGLKQPSPTNPVQYPGGTFSKVAGWDFNGGWDLSDQRVAVGPTGFQNGAIVKTRDEDWGTWIGKSEAHGAGQLIKIPAGSVGEVLGQDPTTGMVQVLIMDKIADKNGPLEPYGATAWYWASQLEQRPDIQPPGPAIKRR